MKWIIYLVAGCAIYDIVLLQYNVNISTDVFAPGYLFLIVLSFVIYTAIVVFLIDRKEWLDTRQFLSVILLGPPMLFLFGHIFVLLANVNILLHYIDGLWK